MSLQRLYRCGSLRWDAIVTSGWASGVTALHCVGCGERVGSDRSCRANPMRTHLGPLIIFSIFGVHPCPCACVCVRGYAWVCVRACVRAPSPPAAGWLSLHHLPRGIPTATRHLSGQSRLFSSLTYHVRGASPPSTASSDQEHALPSRETACLSSIASQQRHTLVVGRRARWTRLMVVVVVMVVVSGSATRTDVCIGAHFGGTWQRNARLTVATTHPSQPRHRSTTAPTSCSCNAVVQRLPG